MYLIYIHIYKSDNNSSTVYSVKKYNELHFSSNFGFFIVFNKKMYFNNINRNIKIITNMLIKIKIYLH